MRKYDVSFSPVCRRCGALLSLFRNKKNGNICDECLTIEYRERERAKRARLDEMKRSASNLKRHPVFFWMIMEEER